MGKRIDYLSLGRHLLVTFVFLDCFCSLVVIDLAGVKAEHNLWMRQLVSHPHGPTLVAMVKLLQLGLYVLAIDVADTVWEDSSVPIAWALVGVSFPLAARAVVGLVVTLASLW